MTLLTLEPGPIVHEYDWGLAIRARQNLEKFLVNTHTNLRLENLGHYTKNLSGLVPNCGEAPRGG